VIFMVIDRKAKTGPREHFPVKGKGTKYKIICSHCGKADKVPFKPETRKVLCSRCFRDRKYLS